MTSPVIRKLVLLGVNLAVAVPGYAHQLARKTASEIDNIAAQTLSTRHIIGISIAVVKDSEVIYARGFGFRNLDGRLGANAATTYRIGSVTKQFTAVAILKLQQQGKLSIDDPLSKYVPDSPNWGSVTLRELLQHTSGLPDYTQLPDFDLVRCHPVSPIDIIKTVANEPFVFSPNSAWQYSNTNYVLLGMVIEKVRGQKYSDFLEEEILRPLRMKRTSVTDPSVVQENRARGYSSYSLGLPYHAPGLDPAWLYAAGGLSSNVLDLAKFDTALLNGRLLDSSDQKEMFTAARPTNGNEARYGLGMALLRMNGHRMWSHEGGLPGFSGINAIFPDDKMCIIVLANSDSFDPEQTVKQIFSLWYPAPPAEAGPFIPMQAAPETVARAEEWIKRALTGNIDRAQLRGDLDRFLTSNRIHDLVLLGDRLGMPTSIELAAQSERKPTTLYLFRVAFPRQVLTFELGIDTNGEISRLNFTPYE